VRRQRDLDAAAVTLIGATLDPALGLELADRLAHGLLSAALGRGQPADASRTVTVEIARFN